MLRSGTLPWVTMVARFTICRIELFGATMAPGSTNLADTTPLIGA